jgi:hypothetical protein
LEVEGSKLVLAERVRFADSVEKDRTKARVVGRDSKVGGKCPKTDAGLEVDQEAYRAGSGGMVDVGVVVSAGEENYLPLRDCLENIGC